MERRPELPWTDWEKVGHLLLLLSTHRLITDCPSPPQLDLFCEIIKSSHLSPDDLFRIIQAHRISPVWENTALPRGEFNLSHSSGLSIQLP